MRRPEIVQALKSILQRVAPDATTILYGSEARGDARPDSDIDILILVDKEKLTLKEQQEITFPLYDVEVDKGILINPLVLLRKQWETTHRITPLSKENAFFSDLFAKRHSGDYDVSIYFDKDVTMDLYPQAVDFIKTIENLIKRLPRTN